MALIEHFEGRPLEPKRVHAGVTCGYRAVTLGGQKILQLETYGSRNRKMVDTASQTIQLDREAARQLKKILEQSFPGI